MDPELSLPALVALPLITALQVLIAGRWPNLREAATLIGTAVLFILVLFHLQALGAGVPLRVDLLEILPGLTITLEVEPLGMLFALIASSLWIVNSIYSIGYMRGNGEGNQTRFYCWFAVAIAATMLVALSGNMLTLFIGYEVLSLSTYPLVAHHGNDEARRAGRVYLGFLLSSSIGLLLFGMIWTWHVAGTLDFVAGGVLAGKASGPVVAVLLVLYMYGIGKAALMPLHKWLPAAMVAPTPVSALLHAVAVVKTGVFSVVKVLIYIFGIDLLTVTPGTDWLAWMAGFTIIAASVVALRADNLKRRLAYSTISQLAYVIFAAAMMTPLSIVGAALHIAAHAFGKITLFFAAGAIYTAAHKTEISELNGIGRRMPWTMGAFGIAVLSMIGLPPTAGFVSKWFIVVGMLEREHWMALTVIVASTLLNAAYFLPILYRAFFRTRCEAETGVSGAGASGSHGSGSNASHQTHGEAPLPMVIALTATAAVTVALFFWPDVFYGLSSLLQARL